jgi:hypothetical protein
VRQIHARREAGARFTAGVEPDFGAALILLSVNPPRAKGP